MATNKCRIARGDPGAGAGPGRGGSGVRRMEPGWRPWIPLYEATATYGKPDEREETTECDAADKLSI
jgi:hypothetical protein